MRIGVIQQGAGNIHSVCRGLRAIGCTPEILTDGAEIAGYERLVLPGVGAFGAAMQMLKRQNMIEPILAYIDSGKPFLGICLGAQLLMETSEEFGAHEGLGLIPGKVVRIPRNSGVRVPHVGWARLRPSQAWESSYLTDLTADDYVYFTHSLVCEPAEENHVLARVEYAGGYLVAAVGHENVTGVQFHPEISTERGLTVLRCFVDDRRSATALTRQKAEAPFESKEESHG